MKNDRQLCIIIPAYNEANKLDIIAYQDFLAQHTDCSIVFVNDCSTDSTLDILQKLCNQRPQQCFVISNKKNQGKAGSVRNGMQWSFEHAAAPKYAFLDADLATSLGECKNVADTVKGEVVFSFGSRILTVDSNIQRKAYRHYIGRMVATAISNTLKLKVYDTQCGCKVFDAALGKKLFEQSFISRWLFDVELFFRAIKVLGRENIHQKIHEQPLKQWIDKGDSKVKFTYFFQLWLDLLKIRAKYKGV